MRLIASGQRASGNDALSKIVHAGTDEVVAVYLAPDAAGKPADPLQEFAVESGIPVRRPKRFRDAESLDLLKSHDADPMVLACVTAFLPEAARATPELGSICFHPSLLPPHRGPSAVNWPIIRGPRKSGFTWLHSADGLD